MSVISATKFLERLEREETLRVQLYIHNVKDMDKLVQFAHGKGFVVSADDMKTALAQFKGSLPKGSIEPLKQLIAPK